MIELPHRDALGAATWSALLDLSETMKTGWTLIGAQMVALHGYAAGLNPPRHSLDADVLVNVRQQRGGAAHIAQILFTAGFTLEGISTSGIGHRFTDGQVKIDILAPDGLASSNSSLTTIAPARTVRVPGGTQALQRTKAIPARLGKRSGFIPCPNLLGAILLKTRAVTVDDVPTAQLADLTFLLSLVNDPRELAAHLRGRERSWLRKRKELQDRAHPAWRSIPEEKANQGYAALAIICGQK